MPFISEGNGLWNPVRQEDKAIVREQVKRLLETSDFKDSRRYPALFRFIVEETLEGREEFLTEQLLGFRVFGRMPDYDTTTDPIVRVTIDELRKRIAKHDCESAHASGIRIELVSGHYRAAFLPRPQNESPSIADFAPLPESAAKPYAAPAKSRMALGIVAALVLGALGVGAWKWTHPSAIDQFWSPLTAGRRVVTFWLPRDIGRKPGAEAGMLAVSANDLSRQSPYETGIVDRESIMKKIAISDVLASMKISDLMATYGNSSRLRLNNSMAFDDQNQGPAVLVGGVENEWTLRALAPLRFHFDSDHQQTYWITDTHNPQMQDWSLALKNSYAEVTRDYAIVARIHNQSTGEPEVIVAGIGMGGTAAAGDFLVDPSRLAELRNRIGANFRDHDFEAVLGTDVVNGIAGSPRILAVDSW